MNISIPLKLFAFFAILLLNTFLIQAQSFVEESVTVSGVGGGASWGDYDRDGNIDLVTTGSSASGRTSTIYKNNGNSTFTPQSSFVLKGLSSSYVSWGDYNNDGFLDILLNGYTGSGYFSTIYKNGSGTAFTDQTQIPIVDVSDGNLSFCDYNNDGYVDVLATGYNGSTNVTLYRNNKGEYEQTGILFDKVSDSFASWGDYNNDGFADVLISGGYGSGYYSYIYKNNGNNTFTKLNTTITGVTEGSSAWGDYNNDGYLDFIITGKNGSGYYSQIYENNGNETFTLQPIALPGVAYSSVAWGDYDNDGDLDLLLAGLKSATNTDCITKLYKNNNDNTFTEVNDFTMVGVGFANVQFVDYNKDSKLDISVTGLVGTSNYYFKLYKNMVSVANSVPTAPANLISQFTGTNNSEMTFKWDKSTDTETPQDGLSYNLYLYKVGATDFVKAADAFTQTQANNGKRLVSKSGNIQYSASGYKIDASMLPPGTYKWSIQSVDGSLTGSAFAAEQTIISTIHTPSMNLTSEPYGTSMLLSWKRGNGEKCIVVAKENGTGAFSPVNNTTYVADAAFGASTQIGTTGWYCVYNGTGSSITVTGLKPLTSYSFHVIEYIGNAGAENYYTPTEPTGLLTKSTSLFTPIFDFEKLENSSVAWCDYDNDGDLDFVASGSNSSYYTKLYRNDGANTFTSINAGFANVSYSSISWGDYDNDGYADLALLGYDYSNRYTKIYHNNKNGTFTELPGVIFPGYNAGNIVWGDYNNDGFSDLFLCGSDGNKVVSKIYLNTRSGSFVEQTQINIPGIDYSSSLWVDLDNDADLDLLISGYIITNYITKIYRNDGIGGFIEIIGLNIPQLANSAIDAGDYDSDGDLDLLFTGNVYNNGPSLSKVYKNDGNFVFTEQTTITLPAVKNGSSKWADYDNDGDLDIIINGNGISNSKIYKNTAGTFTEETNIILPGTKLGSLAWGDYDNDSDLDLLITGNTGSGYIYIGTVYRNDVPATNTVPTAPAGLTVSSDALLSWNAVAGDATPANGLTYNVRVGTAAGKSDIVSPLSSVIGYRRIPSMGNAQTGTNYKLKNLKKGTYYWSVQAVDNSLAGGPFATEQSFVYNLDDQASYLNVVGKSATSVKCQWMRGNGSNCAVFVKENGTGTASPVNNTIYIGAKTIGTQIGSTGWYCVYNGDKDTATISGLKPNTEYRFQVIEYSGAAGAETYYTTSGTNNPAQYIPPFLEQSQISLTGLSGNTNAWGDYDSDGDLDLIIGGYTGSQNIAEMHRNNGDNTFTKTSLNLELNSYDDLQWGDFDNDNDLDLLVLSSWGSKVFENTGGGAFTAVATLAAMSGGKGEWADLNNDGYKDIIFTTSSETKVYKNNKDKTFTQQTTTMPGVSNHSSIACGDYDNDGDLDVLLAGLNSSTGITKVFRNDGNFVFAEQTGITLPGISNCSVDWADMDNDGDLDLVISGADYDFATKIFDNNGDNTFTEIAGTNFKELYRSSLAIADYDNDGYRDLVVSGSYDGSDYFAILYKNNGNKIYSEVKSVSFPGIQYGSLNWGDYDNDNDPDLFMCGMTATGRISKIFRNNVAASNVKPNTPGSLSYTLNGSNVIFKWDKPADDKTLSSGLTYNLYVYETTKSGFNRSAESFPVSSAMNGRRLVAAIGDVQYTSYTIGYTLKGLPAGSYKFSIQSVDAGFVGSNFATEGSFNIIDLSGVGIHVGDKKITNTTTDMRYSINSTDGINGTWSSCASGTTTYNISTTAAYDVWVRQYGNNNNNRKVFSVAAQAAAPAFTVNFLAGTTTENIPASVEYSKYFGMLDEVSTGIDKPASLTPGTVVFFRVKGTETTVPSAKQSLNVPARPSAPTFTIDFTNETTSQEITSDYEYSTDLTMSSVVSGTGSKVAIVPGQNLYLRTKVTPTAFASDAQTLNSPARPANPAFTIDFIAEKTYQTVSSGYEYSFNQDMSNAIKGTGVKVSISPGQNLFFRLGATATSFKSEIQALAVPSRPSIPNFTINYLNETTSESISSAYECSYSPETTGFSSGPGRVVGVNPGQNLYIRTKVTSSTFRSDIQTLIVPERPAAPSFSIDYINETTDIIPSGYEYSTYSDFSFPKLGSDSKLTVTPGHNLHFWKPASSTFFKSSIQTLTIPARPDVPGAIVVNDAANTFDWTFSPGYSEIGIYEYTIDQGNSWTTCSEKPINVGNVNIGSNALQLRVKASESRFRSEKRFSGVGFTLSTGVSSLEDVGIKMFPNPSSDVLYLENLPAKSEIYIFNLNGKLLNRKSVEEMNMKISVSDLPKGLYVLKIKTPLKEYQSKFTKQ